MQVSHHQFLGQRQSIRTSVLIALCFCELMFSAGACRAAGIAVGRTARTPTSVADPYPSVLLDPSGLSTVRFGSLTFMARDGNQLQAVSYRSTGFDPLEGRIWFVLHGAGRTAQSYATAAAAVAERYDALVIAIRFPIELYPKQSDYTLGMSKNGRTSPGVFRAREWRPPHDYLYAEIEHLFEAARSALGGEQWGYYLFGHSAGAQFVHRLVTFLPQARVLGAVAANAGWYTLPSQGAGNDRNYFMPYGLQGSPLDEDDIRGALEVPLTILLGARDTARSEEDALLRDTAEARNQGTTRLQRGLTYYSIAANQAKTMGATLQWKKRIVPGAGHDKEEIMPSAGFCLFDVAIEPCEPSTAGDAAALFFTEIHADPATGAAGDANVDGVRNASEDEFIELVNRGDTALCLTGWTLGDNEDRERHRFPLAGVLPPGGALVVFGGGQPTGAFGGAVVQWAAFGGRLNLSNAGDVLTLRDATGAIAQQVSWGDCDGAPCAPEHIRQDLNIEGSMVRSPEGQGMWMPHTTINSKRWSPGTRTNGARWQSHD